LSVIHESGSAGDACKSGRDLWLCLRGKDAREFQCLPQREACSNQRRSPAAVDVTYDDLVKDGLEIEVREGAPEGATLARRAPQPVREGIRRRALCDGITLTFDASFIASFTYFLDAPAGPGAPEPVRVPVRPEAVDAGPSPSDAAVDASDASPASPSEPAAAAQPE
jgi:hypothetical protein